jgi:ABC-type nitrate/sulfonate/bicarbonate transport system substrate-binding protein
LPAPLSRSAERRRLPLRSSRLPAGTSAYVLTIGGSDAATHPAVVASFHAALDEGLAWHHAHPDEVDPILVKYLRPPIDVRTMLRRLRLVALATPESSIVECNSPAIRVRIA